MNRRKGAGQSRVFFDASVTIKEMMYSESRVKLGGHIKERAEFA